MKTTLRLLIIGVCFMLFIGKMNAQGIGISPVLVSPNPNAMLDVISNGAVGQGILFPRMTYNQRTSGGVNGGIIGSSGILYGGAAEGLMLYQKDSVNGNSQGVYFNISSNATPQWIHAANGSSYDWKDTGNIVGNSSNKFIGTTDAQGFVLKVNSSSVMNISPSTYSPSIVRGFGGNYASNNPSGALVLGGGWNGNEQFVSDSFDVIVGGVGNIAGNNNTNLADAQNAFVGGGYHNFAMKNYTSVVGGQLNSNSGAYSIIGGGLANTNDGNFSSVGGGTNNNIPVSYDHAIILGGDNNSVGFKYGIIYGGRANNIGNTSYSPPASSQMIFGGENNLSLNGIVIGGKGNISSSYYTTILGGQNNSSTISRYNLVFGNGANINLDSNAIVFAHTLSGVGRTRFGLGDNDPKTSVDNDEAIATRPEVIVWNAGATMTLTPGNRTFYVLSMDDIPANRTLTLNTPTAEGQIFYILIKSLSNNLSHGVTISAPGFFSGINTYTTNTLLGLIYSNGNFYEISRSVN